MISQAKSSDRATPVQSFSVIKLHLDVRLILFVLGIKYAWNIFFLVRFAEQIKETFSSLTVLLDLLQFFRLPGINYQVAPYSFATKLTHDVSRA